MSPAPRRVFETRTQLLLLRLVVWAFEHAGDALTLGGFSLPRVSFITPHVADVLTEQTVRKEGIP